MKLLILSLALWPLMAQSTAPLVSNTLKSPAISKESLTELQLVAANEKPIREALQKVVDAALAEFTAQRNEIVKRECAKYNALPDECGLDLKNGTVVIKPKPDSGEKK